MVLICWVICGSGAICNLGVAGSGGAISCSMACSLHLAIDLLLKVLHQLRDAGNTIVVIEHNLDEIKTADWLIAMGPEGGAGGGSVVGRGTPEELAANPASHTGQYLAR